MGQKNTNANVELRFRSLLWALALVALLFIARLFYLQIIQHSYFARLADEEHKRKYVISAQRGEIYLMDGKDNKIPVVLNETKQRLYADPRFVENKEETAKAVAKITKADHKKYLKQLEKKETAYVILEKKLSLDTGKKIQELELDGVGLQDIPDRVYPENTLASHVIGFVNDNDEGQYGIEQYFDSTLHGKDGLLSGATDVRGIPIATADNIEIEPIDGEDVVLTIDRNIQSYVEQALRKHVKELKAIRGSVIVVDPDTGQIKAMANYPTYSPDKFSNVKDSKVFINTATSRPYEAGSIIKVFGMLTGLATGSVNPDTKFLDKSYTKVDDYIIRNAGTLVNRKRSMTEVIAKSVNTGMVFVLRQLDGNPDDITHKGKQILYEYYHNKFRLGRLTNIEQPGEAEGVVADPDDKEIEDRSNVRYANMTFGQGMSVTMIQAISALSAVVNGGTYYQPTLVHSTIDADGNEHKKPPKVIQKNIVPKKSISQIKDMMVQVVETGGGYYTYRRGYKIGGKTGTAQKPNPEGGYLDNKNREIGSFFGFVPANNPKYVMMVMVDEPNVPRFAGSQGAAPLFGTITDWLIDYYGISPAGGQD